MKVCTPVSRETSLERLCPGWFAREAFSSKIKTFVAALTSRSAEQLPSLPISVQYSLSSASSLPISPRRVQYFLSSSPLPLRLFPPASSFSQPGIGPTQNPPRKGILPIKALPKLEKTESCQKMGKSKFQSTFITSGQVEQFD